MQGTRLTEHAAREDDELEVYANDDDGHPWGAHSNTKQSSADAEPVTQYGRDTHNEDATRATQDDCCRGEQVP